MAAHRDESEHTPEVSAATAPDRRAHPRHAYEALVGLILVDERGTMCPPLVVRARDLSEGGLSIISRRPIETGRRGVVQLVRADGRHAVAGVEVRHCRYVEDQAHDIGLKFAPLPEGVRQEDFLDASGRIALFDPLLAENIGR
jgi:hypothetical protein